MAGRHHSVARTVVVVAFHRCVKLSSLFNLGVAVLRILFFTLSPFISLYGKVSAYFKICCALAPSIKKIRICATLNAGASICREQGEADQFRHRQPHLQGGRSGRHQRPRAGTAAALPTASGCEQSRFRMFHDAAGVPGEGGLEGG